MSHFTVGVILENMDDLEKMLAPYQQNNMGDCPKQFLEFVDIEEESRKSYNNETSNCVIMEDGSIVSAYEAQFNSGIPTHLEKREVKHLERFDSFEKYMSEWEEVSLSSETGKYGYWENPNAKWDWWEIGGRWSNLILTKSADKVNYAKIKDIFFIEDTKPSENSLLFNVNGFSVPMNIAPHLEIHIATQSNYWESAMEGKEFYSKQYCIDRYKNKEKFILDSLSLSTYAVITSDGKWHSKGEMGWFGMSSETMKEAEEFENNFYKNFIENANPEHYFVIVDCHI